jgi:hypothetical protein
LTTDKCCKIELRENQKVIVRFSSIFCKLFIIKLNIWKIFIIKDKKVLVAYIICIKCYSIGLWVRVEGICPTRWFPFSIFEFYTSNPLCSGSYILRQIIIIEFKCVFHLCSSFINKSRAAFDFFTLIFIIYVCYNF